MEARRYRAYHLLPEARGAGERPRAADLAPCSGTTPAFCALAGVLSCAVVAYACAWAGGPRPSAAPVAEAVSSLPGEPASELARPGPQVKEPEEVPPSSEARPRRAAPADPGMLAARRLPQPPSTLVLGSPALASATDSTATLTETTATTATTATSTTTARREQMQSQAARLQHQDGLSYQDVLDLLPVNVIRRVDIENPVFSPIQTRTMPGHLAKFDLFFGFEDTITPGWINTPPRSFDDVVDPKSVLVSPLHVEAFLKQCELRLDASHNRRVVVFGLLEVPLSEGFGDSGAARSLTRDRLSKYFDRIWYYSTDVELSNVYTLPLGVTEMYMRNHTEAMLEAYREVDVIGEWKKGTMLAAWGVYTDKDGAHIPEPDPNSTEQNEMGYSSPAWIAVYNQAMDNRNDAEGWLAGNDSEAIGVDFRVVPTERWWHDLSTYKFLLSPIGTAIQCSRLVEALLVLTVPVVKRGPYRALDDLKGLGFPIVVVDYWGDITPDSLDAWWRDLSPGLRGFRDRCLTSDGFWRLLTAGVC